MDRTQWSIAAAVCCLAVGLVAFAESRRPSIEEIAAMRRLPEVERALGPAALCWTGKGNRLCQWHRPAAPWGGDELLLTCSLRGDELVRCDQELSGAMR